MKTANIFSALFAVLAVILILGTIFLSFHSLDAPVQLLGTADAAEERMEAWLDAVCLGDYTAAGGMMYGQPDLLSDEEFSSSLAATLWDAFGDSFSYAFSGECYATDTGLARDVTITALDIAQLAAALEERAQPLLEQRASEAEDKSEIYDADDGYSEAFLMDVLHEAAVQLLEEDTLLASKTVTLNIVCQDGQWWIVPKRDLINVISGRMAE